MAAGILTRPSLLFLLMVTVAVSSQELQTDDDHEDNETGVRYRIGKKDESVSMTCILTDFLSAWNTFWLKDGQPITEGLSGENQRTLTTIVTDSTLKSEFKCVAKYRLGGQNQEKSAIWRLATNPTVTFLNGTENKNKLIPIKIDPAKLQDVTLTCIHTGVPEPVVTWMFGEDQIFTTSTERHQLGIRDKTATMTISKLNTPDLGVYKCTAANLAGTAQDSITLLVEQRTVHIPDDDPGPSPIVWIVIAVLLVLGAGGGVFFMWKRKNSTSVVKERVPETLRSGNTFQFKELSQERSSKI